jgi:hypothetical protein
MWGMWGRGEIMAIDCRKRILGGALCLGSALLVVVFVGIQRGKTAGGTGVFFGSKPQPKQQKKTKGRPINLPALNDDPKVNAPTPPPANAKIATKVSWCEMQLLGHSYSDPGFINAGLRMQHLHLAQRLDQLNSKLGYEPQKSGLQLLNDVDGMVKKVCAYKKIEPVPAPVPVAAPKLEAPAR